jgi:hypothetical protein
MLGVEMMPIFENKTIITKEVINELSEESFKECNKKYRSFVLLMFLVSAFFTVIKFITDGAYWFSVCMFLSTAFFLFMFLKGYTLKLKESYKNFKGVYGESVEVSLNFYDEKIDIITFRSNLTIEYSQITKVLETENLYSLMIEKQNIILSKSGFINGDIDKFKLFIKEKGLIE